MDIEDQVLALMSLYWCKNHFRLKNIQRNKDLISSLSGEKYTQKLLSGSSRQYLELMRMSRDAYVRLCQHFRHKGWLIDSKHISVEEKIAIFLTIIGHNKRFVVMKRRFQHSSQTGAIGALDGTLVHTVIPANQQIIYRGRGKGVAHDARVLTEIASNPDNGFPFPPYNKYYLCDVAYPNTRGYLAHIIIFDIARFPILDKMAPYSIDVQRDVVIACFAVHNFIRKERLNDDLFNQYDLPQVIFEEEGEHEQVLDETNGPSWTTENSQFMNNMPEELALQLMQGRGNA
ncbi:uncharacterized protein [Nicotiana sylvestris]|uniref:uncharacterized protein n=1 Tax=Nicotiana sylvestris TaxID=4096 RepID=UPI00388CBA05